MVVGSLSARTLAELPTDLSEYDRDHFKHTCLSILTTGVHKWGFIIYRCTYDNDELWNRYLTQLKAFCHNRLVEKGRAELLEQYLEWTIVEDRATLENASRSEVRKHFNRWVSKQNIPMFPAKGYLQIRPIQLPRFRYCAYVDKQCLDTVIQYQEANNGKALFLSLLPPMVLGVIDRTWTPNGNENEFDVIKSLKEHEQVGKAHVDGNGDEDSGNDDTEGDEEENEGDDGDEEEDQFERGYPLIDGSDRKYVGWMYCSARYILGLYESLHGKDDMDDGGSYFRPPGIYPHEDRSIPR